MCQRFLAGCVTQREMSGVSVAGYRNSAGLEGDVELVDQQGGDREDRLDSTKEVAMNRKSYEEECTKFAVDSRWVGPLIKSVIPEPDAKADCTLLVARRLPARVQPCEAASWGYFRAAKMNSGKASDGS